MLYDFLKIAHILSASVLIFSISYSFYHWRNPQNRTNTGIVSYLIQKQTWVLIIPFALLQLATGFTMISLKHEALNQLWIQGSAWGFVMALGSWFLFLYFLLSEQAKRFPFLPLRKIQSLFLGICVFSVFSMIFFMANKI
jgi:uncharacterized membrane protein